MSASEDALRVARQQLLWQIYWQVQVRLDPDASVPMAARAIRRVRVAKQRVLALKAASGKAPLDFPARLCYDGDVSGKDNGYGECIFWSGKRLSV